MVLIEIKDDQSYTIKISEMKPGETVECPDKTSKIEKLDNNSVKLICLKGKCKKLIL